MEMPRCFKQKWPGVCLGNLCPHEQDCVGWVARTAMKALIVPGHSCLESDLDSWPWHGKYGTKPVNGKFGYS